MIVLECTASLSIICEQVFRSREFEQPLREQSQPHQRNRSGANQLSPIILGVAPRRRGLRALALLIKTHGTLGRETVHVPANGKHGELMYFVATADNL